jgi:protein disulfide-isomerase
MCPYCYIGKRRIEGAIEQFGHKDAIEVNGKVSIRCKLRSLV